MRPAQLVRAPLDRPHLHLEPPPDPLPLQLLREAPLWWALVPIVLVKLAAFVHGVVDIDESDWAIAGRLLGQGALPYVGFVEKKPVLSFLFYLPGALFGYRQWAMQILSALWIFATALLAGRAARAWTRSEDAQRAAVWLYVCAACGGIPAVNAETMMNLPAVAALWAFARAERTRRVRADFVAGLCVAAASLFKHQAGILLVAFALAIAWGSIRLRRGPQLARWAALLAGFALPWLALAGVYAALGHLGELVEWNLLRNLAYAGHAPGPVWPRFLKGVGLGIALSAPVAFVLAAMEARKRALDATRMALALAFLLTWIPVSLGERFYEHYFLQFAPSMCVLAAPALVTLCDQWDGLSRLRRAALAFAVVFPMAFWAGHGFVRGMLHEAPLQDPRAVAISSWLREHSEATDRLFVWGHYSPIYYLADRLPGTRYYATSVHVGDFDPAQLPDELDLRPYVSDRDVEQTIADLEASRARFVVDTAPSGLHRWNRVPLSLVPRLDEYVRANYRLVAEPAGAFVYERVSRDRVAR